MTYIQNAAANVRPPRRGEVYRKALTASSVTYAVPSGWNTKFVTMRAIGEDLQFQFGTSDSVSVTLNQVSSGTDPMTVSNASGATLQAGEERSFRLKGETHFAVIGSAGAADTYFELWLSTQDDIT